MSNLATLNSREVDSVRGTIHAQPTRPLFIDDGLTQKSRSPIEKQNLKKTKILNTDELVSDWRLNAEKVASQANSLTNLYPNSPTAWTRSAYAHLFAGLKDEANYQSRQAIEVALESRSAGNDLDVPAVLGALRVLATLGMTSDLIPILESLPRNRLLVGFHASLIADTGDFDQALALLREVDQVEESSLIGYLWLRKNNLPKAINCLRDAIAQNPTDTDAHFNLGIALNRIGSPKKAIRSIGVAVRLSPGRADIRHFYLELLSQIGQWEALRTELADIRREGILPTPENLILEARLSLHDKKLDPAIVYLKKAEIWREWLVI